MRPIVLTPHPVTAVTAVERGSGSTWVDAASWFDVDLSARPVRLDLVESAELSRGEYIRVTFTAGFATVPADFRTAVLQIIAHWYENREATSEGGFDELPLAVRSLVSPHRQVGL
jgi:uncharacterized phiE125 gp8 family phage protein